jgi:hypothetical protein
MIIAFAVFKHASDFFPTDRAFSRNCGFPIGGREDTPGDVSARVADEVRGMLFDGKIVGRSVVRVHD